METPGLAATSETGYEIEMMNDIFEQELDELKADSVGVTSPYDDYNGYGSACNSLYAPVVCRPNSLFYDDILSNLLPLSPEPFTVKPAAVKDNEESKPA